MRKTTLLRMIAISVLMTFWVSISALGTWLFGSHLPFQGAFLNFLLFVCTLVLSGILLFRGLMRFFPLQLGEVPIGSRQEFIYQVFYDPLIYFLFYPLAFSGLIPLPLTRLFYKLWGAQIGEGTYPGRCMIFDPRFVTLGKMVVTGFNASLIPHIMERHRLAHATIVVGDHATIGTNAVIMAGTTVGEGAVVAAGAVVTKHTRIGPNEIWAGVPARCIGFTDR